MPSKFLGQDPSWPIYCVFSVYDVFLNENLAITRICMSFLVLMAFTLYIPSY